MAVLTAAGVIGTASTAEAATSIYWPDSDFGVSGPPQAGPKRRHKAPHHQGPKIESVAKESAKPQGPLIIAISIETQSLKIYDGNGFFAETPISTGMRGHATPMGVFSIIQKHKFHRSNIYSGAPMPYMQRITWSGVAMHAGVLPGYPASHGCIRMPMSFAVKMWGWTKMGARVVVTPGEMTPVGFSHPLLPVQKTTPVASAGPRREMSSGTKSDRAAIADAIIKPTIAEAAPAIRREQAHTADASDALPRSGMSATMSDATPSASRVIAKTDEASSVEVKSEAAEGPGKSAETASSADKPIELNLAETIPTDVKAAEASASIKTDSNTISTQTTTSAPAEDMANPAQPATAAAKAEETKIESAASSDSKAGGRQAEALNRTEKPDDKAQAVNDINATVSDMNKDQARPFDAERPVSKPDPVAAPKRTGQIAVFISRKDSKLYVRQNFAPLFETSVTIASSDRPLGTHVFTARADKEDAKLFHWSVVSLPEARQPERRDDEHASRRRKTVGAVEMKPTPDSATEALDRITIPEDAMAKITDALSTGASIIVSDQGIAAGETGDGTDFIVSLR